MNLKLNIGNRQILFFSIFSVTLIVLISGSYVIALNSGDPLTHGHTSDEISGGGSGGKWSDGTSPGDIYYDQGNVGIGTTNPEQKLQVIGTIKLGTSPYPTNADTLYIQRDANDGRIWTGQSTRPLLLQPSSGNVGIGTTAPQRSLDVSTDGQITFGDSVVDDDQSGIYWHSGSNYGIYRNPGAWSSPDYQQLKMNWATGIIIDGGSAYGKSGTVLQPSGGNVGIGINPSTDKLRVSGVVRADGGVRFNDGTLQTTAAVASAGPKPHLGLYDVSQADSALQTMAQNLGSGGSMEIRDLSVADSALQTIAQRLGPGGSLIIHDGSVADSALITIASNLGPGGSLEIYDLTVADSSLITIASNLGPGGSLIIHDTSVADSSLQTIATRLRTG